MHIGHTAPSYRIVGAGVREIRRGDTCRIRPSASQEPVGSSQASVALMGTSVPPTPHHSARCARGEQRPAEPGRAWPRAEPLYSTLWASERESGPVAVFLIPLVIETTPYRTDTSYSIFAPPKFPCAGPSRACGTAPASQGSIPPESYFALV